MLDIYLDVLAVQLSGRTLYQVPYAQKLFPTLCKLSPPICMPGMLPDDELLRPNIGPIEAELAPGVDDLRLAPEPLDWLPAADTDEAKEPDLERSFLLRDMFDRLCVIVQLRLRVKARARIPLGIC